VDGLIEPSKRQPAAAAEGKHVRTYAPRPGA
jgi:hypothetical protein